MKQKNIIHAYKTICVVCCLLVGGLSGFIFLGVGGAIAGSCVGILMGKLLETTICSDSEEVL